MPQDDERLPPLHPGEVIREEFLVPLSLTQTALARATGISRGRLARIVRHRSPVDAEIALRLSRYFGNSAEFWLGIQMHYELDVAREQLGARILAEVVPRDTESVEIE